jgi:hypothetical protein
MNQSSVSTNPVFRVNLHKLWSSHDSLERDVYTGYCNELPTVGNQFAMHTNEDGCLRTTVVQTNRVEPHSITFHTKNSLYRLEFVIE